MKNRAREKGRKEGKTMMRIIKEEILVGKGGGNGKLPSDIFMKGT